MNFWQRKLLAFLHDPPHKPFKIAGHEDARLPILRHLGLSEEDVARFNRQPDWWAAAADRFPFPNSSALYVDWQSDGKLEFRHPLCRSKLLFTESPRKNSAVAESWLEDVLHGLPNADGDWKKKLFALWRFWMERAAREKHPLMAYLVADTRIPDHTLWHHNGLVSALEGTSGRPAFLLFQIGPVQDFIAQARSMRDLWSGSYLLSFLISKAQAAIASEFGPDTIVYPNLRGAPLLDWWWSQERDLFPAGTFVPGEGRLHPNELLTPSLPNRFLAVLPADRADDAAKLARTSIQQTWQDIADAVHAEICHRAGERLGSGWDAVWKDQVERFPVVDYVAYPWKSESETVGLFAEEQVPLHGGWPNHPLSKMMVWRDCIPGHERESWHGNRNDASVWALHYAITDWIFSAKKNARGFDAWPAREQSGLPKDNLNGRDEILGGPDPEGFWATIRAAFGGDNGDFKGRQQYGAISVIKRLWPEAYLRRKLGWPTWKPSFESVIELALVESDLEIGPGVEPKSCGYYAVLCMDGDDMGQWVGGSKTPKLKDVLAQKAFEYVEKHWKGPPPAHELHRPLTPGFHAALSEALSNFSLYAAGQVVDAFGGQLLYAGGDDVLAMLPARNAINCAYSLQCVYRGELPDDAPLDVRTKLQNLFEFFPDSPGFIRCRQAGRNEAQRPNWPLMMPGTAATASVGIAIGHVHDPMQDVIQAARKAEQNAKKIPGKAAFCLRVLKRSGEGVSFSARWDSPAVGVWDELSSVHDGSSRFPYRYATLLKPLVMISGGDEESRYEAVWTDELRECAKWELRHVLHRQCNMKSADALKQAERWTNALTGAMPPRDFLHFWLAWAFIRRIQKENAQ